jgi:hypothetical protein
VCSKRKNTYMDFSLTIPLTKLQPLLQRKILIPKEENASLCINNPSSSFC